MTQEKFQFTLHEDAYAAHECKDKVFSAVYENGLYSVSLGGESVDYSEDEVDQYIGEGFWKVVEDKP